jgi:hypothetical protein
MKIVFTLACGVAMICNFAQGQDTTLAKLDKMESTIKVNATTEEATLVPTVEKASAEKKSESTFKMPDYSGKHSILNNKVGPKGEELFIKRNKYYYIDGSGKKVKASRTNLTDKPKSS